VEAKQTPDWQALLSRFDDLLARLDHWLPAPSTPPDWEKVTAGRWQGEPGRGAVLAIAHPHDIQLADLQGIATQKQQLDRNTRQFLQGLPANNALLWGAKGTGKSSLIKALLNSYVAQGLRLLEVEKQHLAELPTIVDSLRGRSQRFIVFSDDLSFEPNDASYKALKSVLDGSISTAPDNVLIYATSNRRHLLPEYMQDNFDARHVNEELHQGEAVEEKISLSERFGLWLSFYPFNQDEYLAIVDYWLQRFGLSGIVQPETRQAALQWALTRGSRSGRAAWQFARDWAGQQQLKELPLR